MGGGSTWSALKREKSTENVSEAQIISTWKRKKYTHMSGGTNM